MQQLALGQGIKHLMALETTGFGIDDMEMKRRSKIDRHWMSAMPITCTSTKRRQRVKDCQSAHSEWAPANRWLHRHPMLESLQEAWFRDPFLYGIFQFTAILIDHWCFNENLLSRVFGQQSHRLIHPSPRQTIQREYPIRIVHYFGFEIDLLDSFSRSLAFLPCSKYFNARCADRFTWGILESKESLANCSSDGSTGSQSITSVHEKCLFANSGESANFTPWVIITPG